MCIGYNIIAAVLLARLKNGGVEKKIWKTQFGFKNNSGTFDALCLFRRVLDCLWVEKAASVVFVALGWAKTFERISPVGFIDVSRRFGLPNIFLEIIQSIYGNRDFLVRDMGHNQNFIFRVMAFHRVVH